jgi:hypothetical protein
MIITHDEYFDGFRNGIKSFQTRIKLNFSLHQMKNSSDEKLPTIDFSIDVSTKEERYRARPKMS